MNDNGNCVHDRFPFIIRVRIHERIQYVQNATVSMNSGIYGAKLTGRDDAYASIRAIRHIVWFILYVTFAAVETALKPLFSESIRANVSFFPRFVRPEFRVTEDRAYYRVTIGNVEYAPPSVVSVRAVSRTVTGR